MSILPHPSNIMIDIHANSEKQVLRQFARMLSSSTFYNYDALHEHIHNLQDNETAPIGNGVMIFHGWIEGWATQTLSFVRLQSPLSIMNTPDRTPVDLVLMLLSPKKDIPVHLNTLSRLTRFMHDPYVCDMLRGATSKSAVEAIFDQINHADLKAA